MLRELPLQLHDQLGFTVRGIRVVRANEMFFLLGSDIVAYCNVFARTMWFVGCCTYWNAAKFCT